MAITDLLTRVTDSTTGRPVISALAAPGKALAAVSVNITDATNWTTATAIHFSIYNTVVAGGLTVKDTSTQTDWKGTLAGTTISNLTLTGGTDRTYTAGAIVELTPTSRYAKDTYEWGITHANLDGTLKATAIQSALGLGSGALNGWNPLGYTPSSVTYNGNRSYDLVFSGVDLTGTLSNGYRLRTTRTTAAPNQCTNLNGTTQYYSSASPNKLTFTDDFAVSAWVKVSSYVTGTIVSRYNGTSGWLLFIQADGTVRLQGVNAGAANISHVTSYQSIPLNKWVHVAAQLDMSGFSTTPTGTISYIMIDGVDVPAVVARAGTNPTALVQAGNLEIGSTNGGTLPLPGKIAQAAVFNSKVTQATMRTYMNQGLLGTETFIASAYSFSNSINDLNTTNANNLTANGSAVATTADSPFGNQADGTISTTLDYMIQTKIAFSTNTTVTVQVPEGCTIATVGTFSAVAYANSGVPYQFPRAKGKWRLKIVNNTGLTQTSPGAGVYYNLGSVQISVPVGPWDVGFHAAVQVGRSTAADIGQYVSLSTSSSATGTKELTAATYASAALTDILQNASRFSEIDLSAIQIYYLVTAYIGTAPTNLQYRGDLSGIVVYADLATL